METALARRYFLSGRRKTATPFPKSLLDLELHGDGTRKYGYSSRCMKSGGLGAGVVVTTVRVYTCMLLHRQFQASIVKSIFCRRRMMEENPLIALCRTRQDEIKFGMAAATTCMLPTHL